MNQEVKKVIDRAQAVFGVLQEKEAEKHLEAVREIGNLLQIATSPQDAVDLCEQLARANENFRIQNEERLQIFNARIEQLIALHAEFEQKVLELVPESGETITPEPGRVVSETVEKETRVQPLYGLPALPDPAEVMKFRTVAEELEDNNTPHEIVEQLVDAIVSVGQRIPDFYQIRLLTRNELLGLEQHLRERESDSPTQKLEWMMSHLIRIRDSSLYWDKLDGNQQRIVREAIKLEKGMDENSLNIRDDRADRLAKLILKTNSEEWVSQNAPFRGGMYLNSYFSQADEQCDAYMLFSAEMYVVENVRAKRLPVQIKNILSVMNSLCAHYGQLKKDCPAELLEPLKLGGKISFFLSLLSQYREKARLTSNQVTKALEVAVEYIAVAQTSLQTLAEIFPPTKQAMIAGGGNESR